MSAVAVIWAGKQRVPKPSEKMVLWALADCADGITGTCWPSVAAIAEFTGLDRKTVIAAMGTLQSMRLISDTGRRRGRSLQVKVWQLPIRKPPVTPAKVALDPPPDWFVRDFHDGDLPFDLTEQEQQWIAQLKAA